MHNDRLINALGRQAFAALTASPGARAYYDEHTAWGNAAKIAGGSSETLMTCGDIADWGHHDKQDQQTAA